MNKLIANYLKGDLGVTTPILAVLAAASALFTYSGASIGAESFLEKSRATVFALGGASAIYLFWMIVLWVVPNMKTLWQKTLTLMIVGLGCVLIFWLSSAFNVAGLAGKDALELHQSRYVGGLEDSLGAQFKHALIIEGVAADIRIEIARYKAAAEDEFKNGTYSGTPGPAAVVDALNAIKGRLEALRNEADGFVQAVEARRTQAGVRLEKIRKIAFSNKPLPRRMRDIAKESDLLRSALARMDAKNLAESVKRTLEALPREIALQARFSKDAEMARRQREALARVGADVEQSARTLGAFIEKATEGAPAGIRAFEKISAVRAVVTYWENYIPFWAGSISLDIAPLAVVVFMLIAMNTKTPAELARIRMMHMTVEELVIAKLNEETVRRVGLYPESLRALNHEVLGMDGGDHKGDDQ